MKLRPLIPVRRDPRTALVRQYQTWLNANGADIKVDGKYGDATEKAAQGTKPPPELAVPPLCMWSNREWLQVASFERSLVTAMNVHRFKPARIGLFLNGLEHKDFKPFGTLQQLAGAVSMLKDMGVGVDLTTWARPSKTYLDGLIKYVAPILNMNRDVRLDLDAEGPWGGGDDGKCEEMAVYFWEASKLAPERVSVNDYASLQSKTRHLLRPGVRRRPQAYSVAYVTHGGKRKDTVPDSVYWPGETQAHAMQESLWGGASRGETLDIGLAAYKPFTQMSVQDQVFEQVRSALWHSPSELWFWCLQTQSKFIAALGALQR